MSNHGLRTLSPGPCRLKLMQALQAGLTMSSLSSLSSDTTTTEEEEEEARIELEEARTELEAARKEMKNAIVAGREPLALPSSDDDGLVELPSDDCDDGGAWSSHKAKAAPTPAKAARHPHRAKAPPTHAQMTEWSQNPNARKRQRIPEKTRKWLGEPRGDQPRDVIPGPSAGGPRGDHPRDVIPGPSAGDSLAAGNIDLPEEVANDELDDLFLDVTTASPKKEDRSLAKKLRKQKRKLVSSLGPPLQISRPQWCTSVLLM